MLTTGNSPTTPQPNPTGVNRRLSRPKIGARARQAPGYPAGVRALGSAITGGLAQQLGAPRVRMAAVYLVAPLIALALGRSIANAPRSKELVLLAGLVLVVLANRAPRTALVCGLAITCYPFTREPDLPKIGIGLGMVAGVFLGLAYATKLKSLRLNAIDLFVFVYALTPVFILLIEGQSVSHITDWVAPPVLFPYVGFRLIFADRRVREFFPPAVVAGGAVLGVIGVYEALAGHNPFAPAAHQPVIGGVRALTFGVPLYRAGLLRASSVFGHPIAFGMVLLIPLAFALARPGRRYAIATFAILAGEASTLSRGPWLGAVAIFLLLHRLNLRRSLAVALLAVVAVSVGPISKLLSSGSGTTEAYNAHYRSGLLQATFHQATWIGNPNADLAQAIPGFSDVTSLIATTIVRTGIVGACELLVLVGLAILSYLYARHAGGGDRRAACAALIGLLIGFVTVTLITNMAFFFWILLSFVSTTLPAERGLSVLLPPRRSVVPGQRLGLPIRSRA